MKNHFTAVVKQSGDQMVALCLELGVVACGHNIEEVKENLDNAIASYLEYAAESDLDLNRPVSLDRLHEFLYYEDFDRQEQGAIQRPEQDRKIRMLSYA